MGLERGVSTADGRWILLIPLGLSGIFRAAEIPFFGGHLPYQQVIHNNLGHLAGGLSGFRSSNLVA